jgi:tetratricopeptide (TPR) repeat protein
MTCQLSDFIATYINLGNAHSSLNNFTEAVDYLHRALHIAKTVLPKYHRNLASIYNNLADVCAEQGKNNEALEYAKLSFEIKQNCMLSIIHQLRLPTILWAAFMRRCTSIMNL